MIFQKTLYSVTEALYLNMNQPNIKEPVVPNLTYTFLFVYKVHPHTSTFALLPVAPSQCLCHNFLLLSLKFLSLLEENNSRPEVQSFCVLCHTWSEIFTYTKTHRNTTLFLYSFPGVKNVTMSSVIENCIQ